LGGKRENHIIHGQEWVGLHFQQLISALFTLFLGLALILPIGSINAIRLQSGQKLHFFVLFLTFLCQIQL